MVDFVKVKDLFKVVSKLMDDGHQDADVLVEYVGDFYSVGLAELDPEFVSPYVEGDTPSPVLLISTIT